MTTEARASLRTVSRDVVALSDHATFLVGKAQFLLDATLGMVTIDQNNILKIFSVVTVLLLPPVGHRRLLRHELRAHPAGCTSPGGSGRRWP